MLNATLKNAVRYLYGKGTISSDKDIADMTGYNKATVSSYINGRAAPSANFVEKFESVFKVKLKEFEKWGKDEVIEKTDPEQLLTESVLKIHAEVLTLKQMLVEVLAGVTNRSVMDIQTTVDKALQNNLAKLLHELKHN